MQSGHVEGLSVIVSAPSGIREKLARAIGDEALRAARASDEEAYSLVRDGLPPSELVRLHPVLTSRDPVWLNLELEAVIARVSFPARVRAESDRQIGRMRPVVVGLIRGASRAQSLIKELARFDDSQMSDGPSPLSIFRRILASSIRVLRATLEALTATDPVDSASWLPQVEAALDDWAQACSDLQDLEHRDFGDVSRRDVLIASFGAAGQQVPDHLEGLVAQYGRIDPYAPANYRPSTLFPQLGRETRRALRPGDRLLVFAERQLRSIGLPAPPLQLDVVQDCFQLASRLATQACPTLAHICARSMSALHFQILAENPEALIERRRRFHDEDVLLIRQAAARADERHAAAENDLLADLEAYRGLAEGVLKPWLRLVLDLLDVTRGLSQRSLPASTKLQTLVDQAKAAADDDPWVFWLVDPIEPVLRNAAAHERARPTMDGEIALYGDAGEVIQIVDPSEIRGRYEVLRSAFAGVDCASSVLDHALPLAVSEKARLSLGPDMLEAVLRIQSMVHGQPRVTGSAFESPGRFVAEVEMPWDPAIARDAAHGLGRLTNAVHHLVLRTPEGSDAEYPSR